MLYKFKLKYIMLFIPLLILSAFGDVKISWELDLEAASVIVGEQIVARILVEGDSEADDVPVIENSEDFEIHSAGTSSSSSISFINGKQTVNRQVRYNLILMPLKEGQFLLGPVRVKVDGKTIESSKKILVKVLKEGSNSTGKQNSTEQANNTPSIFLESDVDKKNPYPFEQVRFILRFWTRVQVLQASLGEFKFTGFIHEPMPDKTGQREFYKERNGKKYKVTEILFPLFPTKEGKISLPPIQLMVKAAIERQNNAQGRNQKQNRNNGHRNLFDAFFDNDSFFSNFQQTKNFRLTTKPFEIEVQKLPPNAPSSFNGMVGEFDAKGLLSKNNLKVGDSVTYTLQIVGDGHLPGVKSPQLPWGEYFKFYDDRPTFDFVGDRFTWIGKKVFKWALIPKKEHNGNIENFEISYFNTKTKNYQTIPLSLGSVSIAPGEKSQSVMVSPQGEIKNQAKIEELGHDLMPLIVNDDYMTSSIIPNNIWFLLFIHFVGIVSYFFLHYRKKLHRDRESNPLRFKKSQAYKQFKNNLKNLDSLENGQIFEKASMHLREYIGDKIGIDGRALTPMDAEVKLKQKNISTELITDIKKTLQSFEHAQYGGVQSNSQSNKVEIQSNLENIVKRCEKEL